jgi:hypothetical protein
MHDAADHPAIIDPRYAPRLVRQQRIQTHPLLITQPEFPCHRIFPSTERLNHIQAAMEILFMGLSPRRSAHQGCIVHADRAYDTNRVRDLIEGQRAVPNIPPKRTRL